MHGTDTDKERKTDTEHKTPRKGVLCCLLRGPDLHGNLKVMLTATVFTASMNDFVVWTIPFPPLSFENWGGGLAV